MSDLQAIRKRFGWALLLLAASGCCLAAPAAVAPEADGSGAEQTVAGDSAASGAGDNQQSALDFGQEGVAEAGQDALDEVQAISEGIQALKSQVVELNKDLRLMEEKLLFPSSTKYTVFVSLSRGRFFDLESIKLKLDGETVASHLYSEKQREALARGGVHKLYVTNLNEGKHSATVFFTGVGSNDRPYKRAVSLDFNKDAGSGNLEIAIGDDAASQEPIFELKEW